MKYKVVWNSPRQGIRSTEVDALGIMQAQEQVESMYADIEGFRINHVAPVFEKRESYEPEPSWQSDSSSYTSSGDGDESIGAGIAGVGLLVGGCIILWGMMTLPAGIGAMIIGGGIGWLSWKLGCWVSDRGW